MHVGGITVDLNWFLQLIFTLFIIALGLLHLVKNTASKYFEVDANFEGGGGGSTYRNRSVPTIHMETEGSSCANCGNHGTKKCSRCKSVRYWYSPPPPPPIFLTEFVNYGCGCNSSLAFFPLIVLWEFLETWPILMAIFNDSHMWVVFFLLFFLKIVFLFRKRLALVPYWKSPNYCFALFVLIFVASYLQWNRDFSLVHKQQ